MIFPTWQSPHPYFVNTTSINNSKRGKLILGINDNNIAFLYFYPSNPTILANLHPGKIVTINSVLGNSTPFSSTRPIQKQLHCRIINLKTHLSVLELPPQGAYDVIRFLSDGKLITLLNDHFPSVFFNEACQQAQISRINLKEGYIFTIPPKKETNSFTTPIKEQPPKSERKPIEEENKGYWLPISIIIVFAILIFINSFNNSGSSLTQNKNFSTSNSGTLPPNLPFKTLSDVHIRLCASKSCSSMGIIPKHSTVITDYGNNQENGWYFVKYEGYFCKPFNHTNKTGCTYWDNNIQATGWVYSQNLSAQ